MAIKIETLWLTRATGDPFVDTGGRVIDFLWHLPMLKDKSLLDLIEFAAEVYIDSWGAKLHPFFLNSTITQAQFDADRKKQETLSYFSSLLSEDMANGRLGYCEISGRKTLVFPAGRHNQILSGSNTFVNFNSNLQPGIYLSKEMLIRIFFVPLGVRRLADKLALIISNNEKVANYFVGQNCTANMEALMAGTSEGPLKSIFRNPANALFRFIDQFTSFLQDESEEGRSFEPGSTQLELYHFSNLGQKPDLVLYELDNRCFGFYSWCIHAYKRDWTKFVVAHYNPDNLSKSVFDQETQTWRTKEGEEITFEEYQKWKNFVLNNLLHGKSILKYFLRWAKNQDFPLPIVWAYQINLRGMQQETIEKIESLAMLIVAQGEPYIEQAIGNLNNAMSRLELRKFFLELQKMAFQQNNKPALISTEEFTQYLLPPGRPWGEIRDLLTIAVYEKRQA